MSESQDSIISLIKQLEAKLAQSDELDSSTKDSLSKTLESIKAKMDDSVSSETESDDEPHSIGDRLQEMVQNFESSHPDLAAALDRVITNLGQIGL